MKHFNYRIVIERDLRKVVVAKCMTSEEAKVESIIHGGRIECYVWGYGWVRWCESMREVAK
jgi:L-lactate utilization protein LutB